MAQLRTIKKYPNRRLYDTEISSYITLEEVRQLVLDNEEFEVRDAKSGDDLTRSVLLQIISEHEERGQPMFTTNLLSQIIRFYGDSLQGFMGSYLEKSLQIFLDQQQQFRSQLNNILGQTPWSMLNDLTERNMDLWKSLQQGFLNAAANSVRNGLTSFHRSPINAQTNASPTHHTTQTIVVMRLEYGSWLPIRPAQTVRTNSSSASTRTMAPVFAFATR